MLFKSFIKLNLWMILQKVQLHVGSIPTSSILASVAEWLGTGLIIRYTLVQVQSDVSFFIYFFFS